MIHDNRSIISFCNGSISWVEEGCESASCCRTDPPLVTKTLSLVKCPFPGLGFILILRAMLCNSVVMVVFLVSLLNRTWLVPVTTSKNIRKEIRLVPHAQLLPESACSSGF